MPRRVPVLVGAGIVLLLLLAPPAAALSRVNAQARENGCPRVYCFDLTSSALPPNDTVTVTLVNPTGNAEHSFCVQAGSAPEQCAPASGFAAGGTVANVTFTTPASGNVTYRCSVPGHDALGMKGGFTLDPAAHPDAEPPAPQAAKPAPGFEVALVLLAALVAGRKR
jgi:plastocyanin